MRSAVALQLNIEDEQYPYTEYENTSLQRLDAWESSKICNESEGRQRFFWAVSFRQALQLCEWTGLLIDELQHRL